MTDQRKNRPARMTLELETYHRIRLKTLSEATGRSLSAVVRSALGLYWLVSLELRANRKLVIVDRTTGAGREILLPEFEPKNGHALDKNSPLG